MDYPGEWLLDLPLIDQSFEQWSAAAISRSESGVRKKYSQAWREFIGSRDIEGPNDEDFCRHAAELWRDYLSQCKEHGFVFLQPGQFLCPSEDGEDATRAVPAHPYLWFCPLPKGTNQKQSTESVRRVMESRYDEYRLGTGLRSLKRSFGRYSRQIVLVDVMAALTGGEEIFDDTCDALSCVFASVRARSDRAWERIRKLVRIREMEKVAFVATKADHIPRLQRKNLAGLLGAMLKDERADVDFHGFCGCVDYVASVAATEEEKVVRDGLAYDAVVGIRADTGTRAKVIVPPLPADIPDQAYWTRCEAGGLRAFTFPVFRPPRINTRGRAGIKSIRMDKLLNFVIADRLR